MTNTTHIKKKTLEMLSFYLNEMERGHRCDFNVGDLLHIKAALDNETPSAYFILAAIHNALQFLDSQHEDQDTKEKVERFLIKFQQQCVQEFLSTAASLPDGLFLLTETAQQD